MAETRSIKVTVSDLEPIKKLIREASEMIEATESLAVKLARLIAGEGYDLAAIAADYPASERLVLIEAGLIPDPAAGGADRTGGAA